MRNRKVQRMLRKTGEKGLSPRDSTGLLDLTPFEAVKEIIKKEKAEAIREAKEKLREMEEAKAAELDAAPESSEGQKRPAGEASAETKS